MACAIWACSKALWRGRKIWHNMANRILLNWRQAYAFGIARNHPFVDGNKRTAAVVSETFLALNGSALLASDAELVVAVCCPRRR